MAEKPTYEELQQTIDELRRINALHVLKEENLQEGSGQLGALIESIPDVVFFKDGQGRHLIVNRACEETVGLERRNILGKTNDQLLPPDLAGYCNRSDSTVFEEQKTVRFEEHMIKNGGETVFFETIKFPVFDKQNHMTGLGGVSRDITERKRVEEALRESERRYGSFVKHFQGIAFGGSMDFTPVFFHGSVEEVTGYTEQDFLAGQPRWEKRWKRAKNKNFNDVPAFGECPFLALGLHDPRWQNSRSGV